MSCIFCDIISGREPAHVVFETANTMCILPLEIEAPGHCVILTRSHVTDLFDAKEGDLGGVLDDIARASRLVRRAFGADGVNVLHASGTAAQQSVFHLHFHIIPRWSGDGIDAWPKMPDEQHDPEKLLTRFREAL